MPRRTALIQVGAEARVASLRYSVGVRWLAAAIVVVAMVGLVVGWRATETHHPGHPVGPFTSTAKPFGN